MDVILAISNTPSELDRHDAMRSEKVLRLQDIYDFGAQLDLVHNDIHRILEQFRRRHSASDRILHLLNDKKLLSFLESSSSSVLVIRDDTTRRERGYLAASFAAATIVQWLRRGQSENPTTETYTLACFCNISTSSQRFRSARYIMIQLVSQLMQQFRGLTRSIVGYDLHDLWAADTGRLVELFECLIRNLPQNSVVYCFIDAFDPSSRFGSGNDEMLTRLLNVARQPLPTGTAVKMLLTCSNSAVGFRRHLNPWEILDLGPLKRCRGRGPAHPATHAYDHTAVWKLVDEQLVRKHPVHYV